MPEQPTVEKPPRVRVVMYLDPGLRRLLRRERGETDRPVGAIVEEILLAHFTARDGHAPSIR